jgi:hypothetical protein
MVSPGVIGSFVALDAALIAQAMRAMRDFRRQEERSRDREEDDGRDRKGEPREP